MKKFNRKFKNLRISEKKMRFYDKIRDQLKDHRCKQNVMTIFQINEKILDQG